MGAEVFMFCVKNRQFQCINDSADRVDESACEEPVKGSARKTVNNRTECKGAKPSHRDVYNG